jgi:OmpA-OmpF porin, OOP family
MRARLIIALAFYGFSCGGIGSMGVGLERARADDFDDDFGSLPPKAAPAKPARPSPPSTPAPAPAAEARRPATEPALPAPAAATQRQAVPLAQPAPAGSPSQGSPTPSAAAAASTPATAPSRSASRELTAQRSGDGFDPGLVPAATPGPYPPLDDVPPHTPRPRRARQAPQRRFVHPTVSGLNGGVHVVDASSAAPGTFRVAFNTEFFRKNGFVSRGDHHRHAGAMLNLNVTPIDHLELAAQLATYATENRGSDPEVVQVVGDTRLFAKGHAHVLPWLGLGGDLELALLNGVGSIGVDGRATSVGLRAAATADLRAFTPKSLPLVVRANVRYLFDNSARLTRDVERERYDSLDNPTDRDDEYRHLVTPAERYALQINRVDRMGASLGLEVPLLPRERVHVSPLLEWSFALPVNRQGYDCVQTRLPGRRDGCLEQQGFASRPSFFTFGVRVQPYVEGLALLAALDVASSGHKEFVRELAPLARYAIRIGVSYAYDPRPRTQRPSPARVASQVTPHDARGHIVGQVVESQTGEPVSGAIVHFEGTSLSDVVTDEHGAFRSAELSSGAQGMRIRAQDFREALCVAVVSTSGGDVQARCELAPSAFYGALSGRIVDQAGSPVANASVAARGPSELTLLSNQDGSFRADKVREGEYELAASAPGHFPRSGHVTVARGGQTTPSLVLIARPSKPLVRRMPKRLVLLRPVQFASDSAIILPASEPMLAELAELLQKQPELAQLEIQGHVDDANAAAAQTLSEQRAEAVRAWLVNAGVASSRLQAVGYGATRPLVPNITAQNRARNRRIELLIK